LPDAKLNRQLTRLPWIKLGAMDLNYSADELAFPRPRPRLARSETCPPTFADKVGANDHLRATISSLAPHPREAGLDRALLAEGVGRHDWTVVQRYIFEEECGYAGTPPLIPFGLTMCASVLLKFGTPAQKQHFLPRIYNGDDFWCQGYSEPGAGSDLASLKTRATRDGDHYIVEGQKTWTTLAHYADWIFCLVRTDSAAKKQEGISFSSST
jgi:alkylation response protein AidB-like acyl-CoA dehydrogenase